MAKGETITDPSRRIYIDPEPCVGVKKAVILTYPQRPDCVAGVRGFELADAIRKPRLWRVVRNWPGNRNTW